MLCQPAVSVVVATKIIGKSAEGWGHKDTLTDYYEMLLDGTLGKDDGIDIEGTEEGGDNG